MCLSWENILISFGGSNLLHATLLVDDDWAVCTLRATIVKEHGYEQKIPGRQWLLLQEPQHLLSSIFVCLLLCSKVRLFYDRVLWGLGTWPLVVPSLCSWHGSQNPSRLLYIECLEVLNNSLFF